MTTRLFSMFSDLWRRLRPDTAMDALAILRPSGRFAGPDLLAPVVAFGVLVGLSVVSGVALASLGVLLLSLLVLHLICTEILGIRIEVKDPRF